MSEAPGSRAGSMFGPYLLKRRLGRGGMGEVYEAEHTVKGWRVAVKLMSESVSKDPVFRERIKREARIAGRLQEPHVVPIHDYGELDGQLFLEMRLIQGTDLDSLLKRYGPLTAPRTVAIVNQIASALDAAHTADIMHRDVKPPNILVTTSDFAYLVDFGIANAKTDEKLTQLGTAVGTWKYMAPERFSNVEADYRADIYSLACVLYECLTGSTPYDSDSAGVLISNHMMDPIPLPSQMRPDIPKAFDAVVARGMAKRPEDRYESAGDLALAAHEALSTPDQSQAANILRNSTKATVPHRAVIPPGLRGVPPPPQSDPDLTRPVPPPVPQQPPQAPPPPQPPPAWAGPSGPMPQQFAGVPSAPMPQHFAGPAAWHPQHPQPAKRSRWPIVAGAAALAIVLVIAGLLISGADRHSDSAPDAQPTTTTRTSTRTSTATTTTPPVTTSTTSAAQARLMNLLPAGYPAGSCTPASEPMKGAVVSVKCGQNGDPNGPTFGAYGLYTDAKGVQDAFTTFTGTIQVQNCPGGKASPGNWWHNKDPNNILGKVACGVYKGTQPQVMWSNQQSLVVAVVAGPTKGGPAPNLDQLYQWWATHS